MEKPKQEDFTDSVVYMTALEEYIKQIENNKPCIEIERSDKLLKGVNDHGIQHYKKSIAEQDAINKALKKPEKIIKIKNDSGSIIHIDLHNIEYIIEISETRYNIYMLTERRFEISDENFSLLKLIKLWKKSK